MRISDWSSDVCSSDLAGLWQAAPHAPQTANPRATMTLPIKIEIRAVYKVFGAKEVLAVQLLKQGADTTTVQAETGCNVGLAGVSALIPKGQISCIMGLSGSGKSTLVRNLKDRKSTRLNSSHYCAPRMPFS